MAKYISASTAGGDLGIVTNGCSEAASQAAGSAVAWDLWTYIRTGGKQGCWRVTGMPIPIGDTDASIHKGFEIFNRNMQANGSESAVPSNLGIPGPTIGVSV